MIIKGPIVLRHRPSHMKLKQIDTMYQSAFFMFNVILCRPIKAVRWKGCLDLNCGIIQTNQNLPISLLTAFYSTLV